MLGRTIIEEKNRFSGYQEISGSNLNDLRLLAGGSSINALNYLLYLLNGRDSLANAVPYLDKVIKNDMNTQEWLTQFYKPQNP
ncbi:hypothetical protein ACO0LF_30610 [Undibacterium sp. Di27W]|uniref:hypothetical protein n=1 Tax=Undibacterium sp. Di27W TaxID=3413036 RepID=UPI003BF0D63B